MMRTKRFDYEELNDENAIDTDSEKIFSDEEDEESEATLDNDSIQTEENEEVEI